MVMKPPIQNHGEYQTTPFTLNEWISCNYKTTQLLQKNCLMRTLQNHSSIRYNMPNTENYFSQTKEEH